MKQGSIEWLKWRKQHVGASDQTHLHWAATWSIGWRELWRIKTNRRDEVFVNPHMARGTELEEEARNAYIIETGIEVIPALIESQEFPHLAASLDGATSDFKHFVEIKCPGKEDHAEALRGVVPNKYLPQLYHQMFVGGLKEMDYASFDGTSLAIVHVKRDDKITLEIIKSAHDFWGYVRSDQEPVGEYPHPLFDIRIPQIFDPELLSEVERNIGLRDGIDRMEALLDQSNKRLLESCKLDRAKIGGLQIVTVERKGAIQYEKIPALQSIELDRFRGKPTVTRSIRRAKSSQDE